MLAPKEDVNAADWTFTWYPELQSAILYIADNTEFDNALTYDVSDPSFIDQGLLSSLEIGKVYYWKLQSAAGVETETLEFKLVISQPELMTPVDTTIDSPGVTFQWVSDMDDMSCICRIPRLLVKQLS